MPLKLQLSSASSVVRHRQAQANDALIIATERILTISSSFKIVVLLSPSAVTDAAMLAAEIVPSAPLPST
jgi:hypothetical protein